MHWIWQRLLRYASVELDKQLEFNAEQRRTIRELKATNANLRATIEDRDALSSELAQSEKDLEAENSRLQQLTAIKDEIIEELRMWVEEMQSAQAKRIAMNERARVLAMRSMKLPEQDAYDELS